MESHGSSRISNVSEQLISRLQEWFTGPQPVMVFVGAGISVGEPSARPSGKQLQRAMVEVFVEHSPAEHRERFRASLDNLALAGC